MGDGEVFGVVGGEQVKGLVVSAQGRVEVVQEHRFGLAGGAGFAEPL